MIGYQIWLSVSTCSLFRPRMPPTSRCSKASSLKVERVSYHQRRKRLLKGLKVYGEATLTNLPLYTDLRRLVRRRTGPALAGLGAIPARL